MVGRDLDGRYRIGRLLGRGGMGAVYEGVQLSIGRKVAVKLLRVRGEATTEALQRFAVEARAVGRLEHPHIVRVYDYGMTDEGIPYLVMELLIGQSLAHLLKASGGALPIAEAIRIVAQASRGLAAAHRRGIVHRDIKPGNIWIGPDPERTVKVIDFGMAIGGNWPGTRITATGLVVGTPTYMSPEQAEGTSVYTPAADVYALGLLLFRLVVGHNPFARETVLSTLMAQLNTPIPDVSETDAGVPIPPELSDIWYLALAKWPDDRYADAAAFRAALLSLELDGMPAPLEVSDADVVSISVDPAATGDDETQSAAAAAPTATEAERKLVTALALRLAGEGGSAAESRFGLMAALIDECAEIMATFGGACVDFVDGNGVRALFGVPVAREDDAHRALQAALAVRERVAQRAPTVATHLGLHTLTVLALPGPGRRALRFATDPYAVATAAAESGLGGGLPVMTSPAARTLRRSLSAEPSVVGEVRGEALHALESPSAVRPIGHGASHDLPLVGRDTMLAELASVVRTALFRCNAAHVVVRGAAGTGKTRLLHELSALVRREHAESAPVLLSPDPRRSGPYGLFRALLRALDTGDIEPGARLAMERLVGSSVGSSDDHTPPQTVQLAGAAAFSTLFSRLAADGGLVLLIDDRQEADFESVELLRRLLSDLAHFPIAVVSAGRPDPAANDPAGVFQLGALESEHARALVQHILGADAEAPLVNRILHRAGGNPLFLAELARSVQANRAAALPDSIHAILRARIDALPAALRDVLKAAAIVGDQLWTGAVEAQPDAGDAVADALEQLQARGFLRHEPHGRIAGETQWRFASPLVREVVYQLLLRRRRREGHAAVAKWLVQGAASDTFSALIAVHHDQAGHAQLSGEAWALAGDAARLRCANRDAVTAYQKALARLAAGDMARRAAIEVDLAVVLQLTGAHAYSREMLEKALAEKTLAVGHRVKALRYLARSEARAGRPELQMAHLERAYETAGRAEDADLLNVAADLSFARLSRGDDPSVEASIDEAIEYAYAAERMLPLLTPLGNLFLVKTILLTNRGDLAAAEEAGQQALRTFEEIQQPVGQATALNSLSVVQRGRGRWKDAVSTAERAAVLLAETGNPVYRVTALTNVARARLEQGEALAARTVLRRIRVDHAEQLSPVASAFLDIEEALAAHELGFRDEARTLADDCLLAAEQIALPDVRGRALHAAGVVLGREEHLRAAARCWRKAERPAELHLTLTALARLAKPREVVLLLEEAAQLRDRVGWTSSTVED